MLAGATGLVGRECLRLLAADEGVAEVRALARELEEAVQALGYPSLTIARPSLLLGDRGEWRFGEELAKRIGWLAPPRWRPVHAAQVAAALVSAAHKNAPGLQILENAGATRCGLNCRVGKSSARM